MNLTESYRRIREKKPTHLNRIKVRFAVIGFFILSTFLFRPLLETDFVRPVLLLCFIGSVSNLVSLLWIMWGQGLKYNIYFATLIDVILITVALHYLGGIESTFSWVYVIVMVAVASLHGIKIGMYVATMSSLCYSALLVGEFSGIIPHIDFHMIESVYLHGDSSYLYYKLLSNYILFFTAAGVSGTLSQKLLRSKERLEQDVEQRTNDLTIINKRLQQEITDHTHAEEARRKSESRYRLLAENVTDVIWTMDIRNLRFTYISPSVLGQRGYTVEEAMGLTLSETLTPASLERAIGGLAGQLAPENVDRESWVWSRTLELEQTRKDGSTILAETTVTFVRDEKGKPVELLGVSRDITDRKRAEKALRESEEKYRTLLDSLEVGYYETDLDGNLLSFNDTMRKTLGYGETELKGTNFREFVGEKDAKIIFRAFNAVFKTGIAEKGFNSTLNCKDATKKPIEFSVSLVHDDDGQPIGFRGVARDISDKKQLEQQLLQSQKMESIGTLAGGIAHDFNNLLGGILGFASLAKTKIPVDHKVYEYLNTIEKSSSRAAELTSQLLAFARGGKYEVKPVNLNNIVDETLDILERTFEKSVVLEKKLREELPTVEADAGQLQQVIMNLCLNARDAMDGSGKLIIQTEMETISGAYAIMNLEAKPGPYVILSVSDTGVGIDKEKIDRIFEPFFTTKKEGKGTGLGLSMVYGVVKNHGGFINVYSELCVGTTFKIYLPLSGKLAIQEPSEIQSPAGGSESVLVVDDEESIRDLAKEILESYGYTVMLAEDGLEAVELYIKHKKEIDLVILDMAMPKMGGRETFLKMKSLHPEVKALLSTGYSQDGKATGILNSGVKGFIQKPYQADALLSKVRSILDAEA